MAQRKISSVAILAPAFAVALTLITYGVINVRTSINSSGSIATSSGITATGRGRAIESNYLNQLS
jgi:hypothetical protein